MRDILSGVMFHGGASGDQNDNLLPFKTSIPLLCLPLNKTNSIYPLQ